MKITATRVLGAALLSASLFAVSCKHSDDGGGGIVPKGANPGWGPTMHQEMLAIIEQYDSLHNPPIQNLSAQQARLLPTIFTAERTVADRFGALAPVPIDDTFGREVPVPATTIHVRVYKPRNTSSGMAAIVYYHGGGWIMGSSDRYDASARAIADQTGAIVFSVDYRLAPENKFPTPFQDAFTAYKWVIEQSASFNIDINKLAVAGEGAGANLACNVAIAARDAVIMTPKFQVLIYPITQTSTTTNSYQLYSAAEPLSGAAVPYFLNNYLTNHPTGDTDRHISLVNANLLNLPPTLIINAEIDPLRDDGQLLETQLRAVGVPVERKLYDGVTHDFFGMNRTLPEARDAEAVVAAALRTALQ